LRFLEARLEDFPARPEQQPEQLHQVLEVVGNAARERPAESGRSRSIPADTKMTTSCARPAVGVSALTTIGRWIPAVADRYGGKGRRQGAGRDLRQRGLELAEPAPVLRRPSA
jgi:hypothetical protein